MLRTSGRGHTQERGLRPYVALQVRIQLGRPLAVRATSDPTGRIRLVKARRSSTNVTPKISTQDVCVAALVRPVVVTLPQRP